MRVVGLFDGVVDGVVETGDSFALMPDLELVVASGDGGGDESSNGHRVGDGPVGAGNVDGSLLGDVTHECDPAVT